VNPGVLHKFILLKEPSEKSDQPLTFKSLILLNRVYVTLDGSTEVHEAIIKDRPGKFAVKIMYCRSELDLKKKQNESILQMSLKHPNICVCHSAFLDESYVKGFKYVIVMEFSENGDLEVEIERRKLRRAPWTESEILNHFTQLVDAFAYLQEKNLAHGDIKPRNLYLSGDQIKIGDFGDSNKSPQTLITKTYQVTGTVVYFSPLLFGAYLDIIKGKNSDGNVRHNPIKSDVFSLGLSFLHMASLAKPIELNNLQNGEDSLQQKIEKIVAGLSYSDRVKNVLSCMLQVNESKRYDFLVLKEFLNPSLSKNLLNEGLQRVSRSNSLRCTAFQVIAILQSQGKANVYDSNFKLMSLNNTKIQSSSRAFIIKDSTIITGGLKNSRGVFKIQITTGKSTKLQDLNISRSWHSTVVFNSKFWLIGGRADNKETLTSTEIFEYSTNDLLNEKWTLGPEINISRENASAVSTETSIFLFGGSNKSKNKCELITSIEQFRNERWEILNVKLEKPSSGLGLAVKTDGNILILGGNREKGIVTNETFCFDIKNSVITKERERLSEPDFFASQCTVSHGESIYFLGALIGVHVFDEVSGVWYLKPY
jgi:serine/threonine protein kinase